MSIGFLNFDLPQPDWLNFGRTAEAEFENELTIEQTLAPVSGLIALRAVYHYEHVCRARWNAPAAHSTATRLLYGRGSPLPTPRRLIFTPALPVESAAWIRYGKAAPLPVDHRLVWGLAAHVIRDTRIVLPQTLDGLPKGWTFPWQRGASVEDSFRTRWQAGLWTPQWAGVAWGLAERQALYRTIPTSAALRWLLDERMRWGAGQGPPHGWRAPPYPPYLPGKHWGRLNFVCLSPGTLNFGNLCFGSSALLVPIRRSYRVLNQASLIRVSDEVDIPVTRLSVKLDQASWCWTLQATLPNQAAMALVPAYPGKVRATINGFAWDFIVDELTWNRRFGEWTATLNGRSPGAVYAEPYQPAKSYRETSAKTAEQLALQELGPGWSLDWQLPMWTVPAGVFQYENLTPIEAMNRIAKSAGGWLYADAQDDVLHVVPKWPQKPWAWTFIPDASLPSSYTLSEAQQPLISTAFESILISGGTAGIAVICTRAGTGGETVAPSVVDQLITDIAAAQARAVQELADWWPMKQYTLTLPLQAPPAGAGLLLPTTTFDFVDGEEDGFRGMVTGVSVDASWNQIVQNVEVVAV